MKTILLTIFFLLILSAGFAQPIPPDSLYLGQKPPVDTPKIFLKGINRRIAISNDGKDVFISTPGGTGFFHYTDKGWNRSKGLFKGFGEPSLSIDGTILYIQNQQPNSYYSLKKDSGWSSPVLLWDNPANKHHLQVTNSGTFYLTTIEKIGARGEISIVVPNDTDISLKSLPSPINSLINGFDFYISRDESYIIFPQISDIHGAKGGDLVVSFKKPDSSWTNPQDLGSLINTSGWEYNPYISPDGKYLFFTRAYSAQDVSTYWVRVDHLLDILKRTKSGI